MLLLQLIIKFIKKCIKNLNYEFLLTNYYIIFVDNINLYLIF